MNIRIIQVRDADDQMLQHELDCIERRCRMARASINLNLSNAITDFATEDWLHEQNAVIIGGSGAYSVYSPKIQPQLEKLMELIKACAHQRLPLFGVCFGHQLIAQTFGGIVEAEPSASEMGTVEMHLSTGGREDPIFQGLPASFEVQSGHSDSITRPPKDAIPLCHNEAGKFQAFTLRDLPIYGTQFHCDLTGFEARQRYLAYRAEIAAKNGFDRGDADIFRPGDDATTSLLATFLEKTAL